MDMERVLSYRPGVFYFRQIAREEADPEVVRAYLLALCDEYEHLRAFVREHGLRPPDTLVLPEGKVEDMRQLPLTDFQRQVAVEDPGLYEPAF